MSNKKTEQEKELQKDNKETNKTNEKVEDLFHSLKKQLEILEDQQTEIEKSFLAYENSIKIIEQINQKISFYKGKLEILNEKNKFNPFNSD